MEYELNIDDLLKYKEEILILSDSLGKYLANPGYHNGKFTLNADLSLGIGYSLDAFSDIMKLGANVVTAAGKETMVAMGTKGTIDPNAARLEFDGFSFRLEIYNPRCISGADLQQLKNFFQQTPTLPMNPNVSVFCDFKSTTPIDMDTSVVKYQGVAFKDLKCIKK